MRRLMLSVPALIVLAAPAAPDEVVGQPATGVRPYHPLGLVEIGRVCLPGIVKPTQPWTLRVGCTATVACAGGRGRPSDISLKVTRGIGHIELWAVDHNVGTLFAGAQSAPGHPVLTCKAGAETTSRAWTVLP